MRLTSYAALSIITVAIIAVSADEHSEYAGRINFISEYYFYQDIRAFFNHKNGELRDAYMASALTEFEAMAVSVDTVFHFGIRYDNYLGMGRQTGAIVFDPRDVRYSVIPLFEFRRKEIFYQAGLDHSCHHEVDRATRPIPPYWNQPYISASSANYRFSQMKRNYINTGRDGYFDKLRWQARAGYFVRKMGGMDKTLLSGAHPWAATAEVDVGYSVYKTKSWLFSANNKLTLLGDTSGALYWTGTAGVDADIYNLKHSAGFFAVYNYEFPKSLMLLSRDRLLEIGFRFRY
ncbi:MAG: hypothetical protein LBH93_05105 [Chitinispirillales bacterium]|jgi:hypothetical protein|nr:hypothetical protein [Chitinispirillales bacterium]